MCSSGGFCIRRPSLAALPVSVVPNWVFVHLVALAIGLVGWSLSVGPLLVAAFSVLGDLMAFLGFKAIYSMKYFWYATYLALDSCMCDESVGVVWPTSWLSRTEAARMLCRFLHAGYEPSLEW